MEYLPSVSVPARCGTEAESRADLRDVAGENGRIREEQAQFQRRGEAVDQRRSSTAGRIENAVQRGVS